MPGRQQTHIDVALTNMSVAYMQKEEKYIAAKVFPMIPVKKQSNRYFVYHKEDWFRDEAAERAPATESAGGDYTIDNTPTYFCVPVAYHKDITEEDRTNADEPINMDQDSTNFVSGKLLLRREISWARKYFNTNIWGTEYAGGASAGTGVVKYWNDPTSTPIEDVRRARTDMAEETGYKPNKLTLGARAFDALCDHPDILDRIKYTERGLVTRMIMAALFDLDEILVAEAIQNTAGRGLDASMSFIFGKHALLSYAPSAPSLQTPSAGYTFAWTGLLGAGAYGNRMRRIPLPLLGENTERIEGEMAFDQKLVAADMGCFFYQVVE